MRDIIKCSMVAAVICATCLYCPAQDSSLQHHQQNMVVSELDSSRLDQHRNDPDFAYMSATPKSKNKLGLFLSKLWNAFIEVLRGTGNPGLVKWLFYLLGAAGLLFLILKMLGMDVRKLTRKNSASSEIKAYDFEENIHELDFESLLQASIENQQYREAIRWLYLFALRKLSDRDLITWMAGKTNAEYLVEIGQTSFSPAFRNLSYYFEYIWYGNFGVEKALFDNVNETFENFSRQLDQKSD